MSKLFIYCDPVYTVPDEFGAGLKFVLSRLFTREFVLHVRGSQIRPVPWFSCVYTAERDEFQTGPKFVRYRVNGVCNYSIIFNYLLYW
jgi:hypothetical protein